MTLPAVAFLLSTVLLATLVPEDVSCETILPRTCANYPCPKGSVCRLQVVQCFAAPCYPIPHCVPITEVDLPLLTCASYDCAPGYYCVMEQVVCKKGPCPQRPRCVPASTTTAT